MIRERPYQSTSGPPAVRESVTVFLDVLGYRDVMAATTTMDEANAELRKLRQALDNAGQHVAGKSTVDEEMEFWRTRTFTDNIVIGYPTLDPHALAEPELGSIFWHLALFQLEMIRAGYFLRGGIAVGELFMDDEIVFGKALLEAYDAERNRARDPRIVLAPSAELLVERHLEWYSHKSFAPHNHALLRDADGSLFVNYLDQTVLMAVNEAGPFLEELTMHRDRVTEKLQRYRGDPRVWSKYEWAARYHNFFCDSHQYFDKSHKVSRDALQATPRPIIDR
jgi:hypothetical protein